MGFLTVLITGLGRSIRVTYAYESGDTLGHTECALLQTVCLQWATRFIFLEAGKGGEQEKDE